MRIIEQMKLTKDGCPAILKGCIRQDLPQFFVDLGFAVGAEIGVHKAEYTEKLLKAELKVYAIDPWKVYDDFVHPQGQKRQDFLYEHAQRVVAPYSGCHMIRESSVDAAKHFDDESLDFVYIDGNHSFRYIAEDLVVWSEKVKKGGVVSGHDYMTASGMQPIHVKHVVNAFTYVFGINRWYVTDLKRGVGGDQTTRSWLWIKE